jgi:hypothetical protein
LRLGGTFGADAGPRSEEVTLRELNSKRVNFILWPTTALLLAAKASRPPDKDSTLILKYHFATRLVLRLGNKSDRGGLAFVEDLQQSA